MYQEDMLWSHKTLVELTVALNKLGPKGLLDDSDTCRMQILISLHMPKPHPL